MNSGSKVSAPGCGKSWTWPIHAAACLKNGTVVSVHFVKKSVPIGVIGIIFEARPNVCVDAAALCLKSGNVCYLRGSRETIRTNRVLVELMRQALKEQWAE